VTRKGIQGDRHLRDRHCHPEGAGGPIPVLGAVALHRLRVIVHPTIIAKLLCITKLKNLRPDVDVRSTLVGLTGSSCCVGISEQALNSAVHVNFCFTATKLNHFERNTGVRNSGKHYAGHAPASLNCENRFARMEMCAASSVVTRGNIDVLEDVLDKESGRKPKSATPGGGVGGAFVAGAADVVAATGAVGEAAGAAVVGFVKPNVGGALVAAKHRLGATGGAVGEAAGVAKPNVAGVTVAAKPVVGSATGRVATATGVSAAGAGGTVVGTAQHVPQDDLEAYVNGRLGGNELDFCRTHLDSCDACRAELEDLRTFRSNAAGLQSSSLRRELDRRKRQRQIKSALTGTAVAVMVAVVATSGWWQYNKWRIAHAAVQTVAASGTRTATSQPSAVASTDAATTAASPAPAASAQPHATPIPQQSMSVANAAALTGRAASSYNAANVSTHATTGGAQQAPTKNAAATRPMTTPSAPVTNAEAVRSVATPVANIAAATKPATAPVAAQAVPATGVQPLANTRFTLLGPFGDSIADTRPEFSWQQLAGAAHYSVVIVDEGLHPINRSHALKTTSWRPRRPLRRGRTYLWQVTATLHNGKKVVALSPSPSQARLTIAPLGTSD